MFKGLVVIALLAITFSTARSEDPVIIFPGEFAPGFLQPGESLIYQVVLTEEELENRTVTLGIFTSDKELLEEDEEFGTNLTVAITREFPNDTSTDALSAQSSRGVAFWPSANVTEGVYYVIVYNLQQVNASFNVTYLLLSDTQFQLNQPVQESLTPFEIIYFHVIIDHASNMLLDTTAVRFDLNFDSMTPILDENSVERLLTISQGDYPTPARHLERANIASETQFLNEQNQTVYRLTLFEEISMLDYVNMASSKWILGFFNTAENTLEATFTVTLIDRSPGALDQTDELTLLNNRKHMLRMSYFVTPDMVPEALVYFEVNLPRVLLPSESITLRLFNTLVLDPNNAITYHFNSSDSTTEYFIAGRQSQEIASRDYAVSMVYTGPEQELRNVTVTPRYFEIYTLPLFAVRPHNALANEVVAFEIPVEEGSLPFLRDFRISTVFHLGLNVRETDITVRIQLRQNRLPTPFTREISYESSVEDLFLELDKSRSLYGKWYALVQVFNNTDEVDLPYSIVASFQNRFEQTLGANVVNEIQPNRWHYYKMTYNAVDNQGVFFDLAYVNHVEGFDHEITREVNFLVSDESDNPFPTFANHAVASRLYWPLTQDFVEGAYVTTRQNVYLPASSFVAGRTYTLYTGLFAAPDSTQVNHAYEYMATAIREYALDTSVEQSVNGHTWVYFTTDMHVPTTLLEAPSRYVGEIHLTSQSNFVANVSVALDEDVYPAFPPQGDNVRDIDIYGELSHFAPIRGDGLVQLAVRNWGPITVHFTMMTAVHIETPVTLPVNDMEFTIAPKQYRFFTSTRSQSGQNPTLELNINRSAKKRSIEQSGGFVLLVSNNGDFPALSDFEAQSATVAGLRVDSDTQSTGFETTLTAPNVVFAIYNEGTGPLQVTLAASLRVPGAPNAVPVSPPVSAPVTETPVAAPVVSTPVQAPVAVAPVQAPIATTPVAVPVAQTPVQAPIAMTPVNTGTPVQAPVYQVPVAEPVYNVPIAQGTPVTDVVQTPSGPQTMHPLFILLIVAGCLAVVGVGVAVIIKMVQDNRKKKTSLSGLEYVELVDDNRR